MRAVFHGGDIKRTIKPAQHQESAGNESKFDQFGIGKMITYRLHECLVERFMTRCKPFSETQSGLFFPGEFVLTSKLQFDLIVKRGFPRRGNTA